MPYYPLDENKSAPVRDGWRGATDAEQRAWKNGPKQTTSISPDELNTIQGDYIDPLTVMVRNGMMIGHWYGTVAAVTQ